MQFVKTALAAAAGAALFCGVAFAGDDDATAKRDRVLDKVEKKLEQERKDVRDKVEKILDDELKGDKAAKGDKKGKPEKKEASDAKPFLGVFLAEAEEGGAQVAEVMEKSPAEAAGLQAGDVIEKVNGTDVADSKGVIAAVATHKPGESVKLDVARGKDHMTVEVKLGTRPEELAANFNAPGDGDEDKDEGADDDKKGEKEEGKPGPGADELRARIKKFMDRMRGDKGDEKNAKKGGDEDGDGEKGEEKPAKKNGKKNGKKLLDDSEDGGKKHQPKKHEPKKDEDEDEAKGDDDGGKGLGDMKNFEDLAKRFMEQFMQPKEKKGEGDEDEQPGADDLMGRLQDFMQSEEGQKMMEELQPMIEKLMENGDLQKLLEQLQNGGGMQPDAGDEGDNEGEDLKPEPKAEPKHEPKKGGAAYLGVSPTELTDDMREQLGIEHGVVVNDVVEDGPAATAGMKKNDVILSIDGTDVEGIDDVRTIVSKHKPGEEVEIVVLRKGKKKTLSVELGKKGAMLPSEGNDKKAVAQDALQNLQQALQLNPKIEENLQELAGKAEERLAGHADKVKKAVQDVEQAMKAMHDGGKSEDPSKDPVKRLQQMAQFAKAFAKNKPVHLSLPAFSGISVGDS